MNRPNTKQCRKWAHWCLRKVLSYIQKANERHRQLNLHWISRNSMRVRFDSLHIMQTKMVNLMSNSINCHAFVLNRSFSLSAKVPDYQRKRKAISPHPFSAHHLINYEPEHRQHFERFVLISTKQGHSL